MSDFERLFEEDEVAEILDCLEIYVVDESGNVNVITLTNSPDVLKLNVFPLLPLVKPEESGGGGEPPPA